MLEGLHWRSPPHMLCSCIMCKDKSFRKAFGFHLPGHFKCIFTEFSSWRFRWVAEGNAYFLVFFGKSRYIPLWGILATGLRSRMMKYGRRFWSWTLAITPSTHASMSNLASWLSTWLAEAILLHSFLQLFRVRNRFCKFTVIFVYNLHVVLGR